MKKLKGPELKLPTLKTPDFLNDIYADLRDRRLLPLVALVVVAIAAVPFLLGDGAETQVMPGGGDLSALGSPSEETSQLRVVEATPGLREYRKRLRHRTPVDPFVQRYTGLPSSATLAGGGGGSGSGGEAPPSVSTPTSGFSGEEPAPVESTNGETGGEGGSDGGSGGGSNGGNGNGGAGGHLIIYDYAIDARVSYSPPAGANPADAPEPFVEQRILPQTAVPGEKAPVVTYLGPGRTAKNKFTGKVLLLVSDEVGQIEGEHRCVSSRPDGPCQLLEVEPGFPLTFAYGDGGAHYTIKVLSIELVVVGRA